MRNVRVETASAAARTVQAIIPSGLQVTVCQMGHKLSVGFVYVG